MAKGVRGQPAYTDGHKLAYMIANYVFLQQNNGKPLTAAGCAIACGLRRETLYVYARGDIDHHVEELEDMYRTSIPEGAIPIYDYLIGGAHEGAKKIYLSDVVNQYKEIPAMEREERLYERGGVADIFALKAVDGWQDESKMANTVNNTLIVNGESAEKALELLGYKKSLPGE